MRVIDAAGIGRLAHEPADRFGFLSQIGLEQLDGARPPDPQMLGQVHFADAPRAELSAEPIPLGDDQASE
jgi:hypothetical protein